MVRALGIPQLRICVILWFSYSSSCSVCSNMIFMCRAKTGRVVQNGFWGNTSYPKVRATNMMVQRMALVWCFLIACRVRFINEQPGSSCLRFMKSILDWLPASCPSGEKYELCFGSMGAFGSRTVKPSYWIGDAEFTANMKQDFDKHLFAKTDWVHVRSDGRVTGNVPKIRETEHYTEQYGQFVFNQWHNSVGTDMDINPDHEFSDSESDISLTEQEWEHVEYDSTAALFWSHADLEAMSRELELPLDVLIVDRM